MPRQPKAAAHEVAVPDVVSNGQGGFFAKGDKIDAPAEVIAALKARGYVK